jgi:hypothetical protein
MVLLIGLQKKAWALKSLTECLAYVIPKHSKRILQRREV